MGGGKIEACHDKDEEMGDQNPLYVKRLLQVDIYICYWFAEYCTCENLSGLLQNTFAVGVSGLLQLECFSPSFKPRIGKIIRGSKVTWSSIDNNKMHQMAFWRCIR